jgi:peptidoglycan L-alanyl-D-glutamate endopeptidase CwlK
MPAYSSASANRLLTCDDRLMDVFDVVGGAYDCTILCGRRGKQEQDNAWKNGLSHTSWPNSKHNLDPSKAIDVAPYPIDWDDTERFRRFAHYVLGVAEAMDIKLRWGGDWDMDFDVHDNRFNDLVHFEVIDG